MHCRTRPPVRACVVAAPERQAERYGGPICTNAELTSRLMNEHAGLNADCPRVVAKAMKHLSLSARSYDRGRKITRTIADLAGADTIAADRVAEALQFRMMA